MAEEMRDPNPKNIPRCDPLPFRFRIRRRPEGCEALTYQEIEEQLLRQLKERGPQDEEKRPGEICRGRYGGKGSGKNRSRGEGRSRAKNLESARRRQTNWRVESPLA